MGNVTTLGDGGDDSLPPQVHESNSFHVVGDGGVEEVRTNDDVVDDDVVLTMPEDDEDEHEMLGDAADVALAQQLSSEPDTGLDAASDPAGVADDDDAHRRNWRAVKLYHLARADGFRGPRWDELVTILAQYGLGCLEGWLISGQIFEELRARGRGVAVKDQEKQLLRTDEVLRQDLADAVVYAALKQFRKAGLDGNGWREDGGAAITTFFLNTCLLVFGNEFRTWQRGLGEWRDHEDSADPTDIHGYTERDPRPPKQPDPTASTAIDRDELARLRELLNDERELKIINLTAHGWTQKAIAEHLGEEHNDIFNTLRQIRRRFRSQMEGNHDE